MSLISYCFSVSISQQHLMFRILHLVKSGWVVSNLIGMISVQTFFLTDFSVEEDVAAFVVKEEDVTPFDGFEMTGVAFLGG
jgi:hypothetical protein